MLDLFDTLLTKPQREKAGSLAQDRFDFQTCWGIHHLIELHEKGNDYAIGFEFHDDIFVVRYEKDQPKVSFYQIKTKSLGSWDIKEIIKQPKSKKSVARSIAGKLFDNKEKFPDVTEHLGFVSNAPASFIKVAYPCRFSQGDQAAFKALIAALKIEFPSAVADQDGELFHFHKTAMPLEAYETHLRGKISEFIIKTCNVDAGHDAFRLALLDQCRSRSKHMRDVKSVPELLAAKFIRRSDLEGWIKSFEEAHKRRPSWDQAQHHLEPISAADLRGIRQQWEKYEADRFNVTNIVLHHMRSSIRLEIDKYLDQNPHSSVKDCIFNVADTIAEVYETEHKLYSINYIRAATLHEYQSS
ncbi:dsDNA nuclease domain-containing protein [Nitrospirillum bahiense]|uniref:Uncharacterized protein DUF4297 n=1 Tax=Nitrospirillum amazonense TaxID=28077 RepID=A0A560FHM9_9PROT|nr:dsDNA nuclease domain-containing protein [Nitrospirillum amazonense]TWB21104.1 uncharacterized protein DUF4297 [Nitrospirillum amazonense]